MGCQLEFDNPPCQTKAPRVTNLSPKEAQIASAEVKKLLAKGVITKVTHDFDELISTTFIRPKRCGSHCLILNLKKLNEHIVYRHFKMDSLQSAVQPMKPDCWMAVLDLKDAYYSVSIRTEHRKYLRFEYDGQLYEFVWLPNGLSSVPRIFTKLLKPALARLRDDGVLLVVYIDDIILLANESETLVTYIHKATTLLKSLGFPIHEGKFLFVPSQKVAFLGFVFDSINMTVSMNQTKLKKLKQPFASF